MKLLCRLLVILIVTLLYQKSANAFQELSFARSPVIQDNFQTKSRLVEEVIRVRVSATMDVAVTDTLTLENSTDTDETVPLSRYFLLQHDVSTKKSAVELVGFRLTINDKEVPVVAPKVEAWDKTEGWARFTINWRVTIPKKSRTIMSVAYSRGNDPWDPVDTFTVPNILGWIWLTDELTQGLPVKERLALYHRLAHYRYAFDARPSNAWAGDIGELKFEVDCGARCLPHFLLWDGSPTMPWQVLNKTTVVGTEKSVADAHVINFSIMPNIRQAELQKLLDDHLAKRSADPDSVLMSVGIRLANNGTIEDVEPFLRRLLITSKSQMAIAGPRSKERELRSNSLRVLSAIEQSVLRETYAYLPALFRLEKLHQEVDDLLRVMEKQILDDDGTVISGSIEQRVEKIAQWTSTPRKKKS